MSQPNLFQYELPAHGAYRRSDPQTSKEAGRAMTGERLSATKQTVMDYFNEHKSLTDEELLALVERDYGRYSFKDSTIRTRRNELVKAGKLRDSGRTKKNRARLQVTVWECVE